MTFLRTTNTRLLPAVAAACLVSGLANADVLNPTAFTYVDDLDAGPILITNLNVLEPRKNDGTDSNTFVANGNSFDIVARARSNDNQNNRQIVTIVDFDVSGLTPADVAAPGFSASLDLDFVGHLNDIQAAIGVRVGQVASGAAADFDLGFDDGDQGSAGEATIALNSVELIENVSASSLGLDNGESVALSVDITAIVTDWFNNPGNNHGLVFFFDDDNSSQGAYFANAQIVTVPEPGSLALLGLGGLLIARRRR